MTIVEQASAREVDQVGAGLATLLDACRRRPAVVRCSPHELPAVLDASGTLAGRRVVIALDTSADRASVVATPDRHDPLVFRTTVDGEGRGPLAGVALRFTDAVAVTLPGAIVLATAAGHPVAVELECGGRTVVVLGTDTLLADATLPAAGNATLVAYALGAPADADAVARVRRQRPRSRPADHPTPLAVVAGDQGRDLLRAVPGPDASVDSPAFWRAAGHAGRLLPAAVHDALVDFADDGHPSGALVVRGLPIGVVPATPASPSACTGKDRVSELVLLAAARRLGQPVGYEPEHDGGLVQNLVPMPTAAGAQTSTSSAVTLEFHTEAAFHPHQPRFLLLLGLRADPFGEARTLLCSAAAVLDQLTLGSRSVLAQPRFRTSADESYTGGRSGRLGRLVPVLAGDPAHPTLTFDADLMAGADQAASDALQELRTLVQANHIGVALGPGDLLVIDNHAAVHGRSPFRARYDGTDRWLQRSFVVADLGGSAGERRGRVVTTRFTP